MIEGTIIQIGEHGGDRFTVDATGYNEHTNGQHRITGTFENTTHPTLVTNGDDYQNPVHAGAERRGRRRRR